MILALVVEGVYLVAEGVPLFVGDIFLELLPQSDLAS